MRAHHGMAGVLLATLLIVPCSTAAARGFDFDTGNAPVRVVVPKLYFALREVSPGGNDASIILRVLAMVDNAWFDAIAPYHPTAVGVYSELGRRPASESATNRNKNVAALYASYRVLMSLLPQNADDWRRMMTSVGLDPDDVSMDRTTPVGIGNRAGFAVVAAREHDGMNQLGDEGERKYDRKPYADYTGYRPVNTAYELVDAGRWQPNVVTRGNGIFSVQQFVTPQYRLTRPYAYDEPSWFQSPVPDKSNPYDNPDGYKAQADEVLSISANLTDEQKMTAELFDDKLIGLGGVSGFILMTRGLTLDEFVQNDFIVHMAAFDAGIAIWNEKFRHDAVRPFTAIRYLYGDAPVTAWGGPGRGTVSDLPASEWRSYLSTADHPEYPSASACFCTAFAQGMRRFLGSDTLGYVLPVFRGASRVEPGVTPKRTLVLGPWETWTDLVNDCAMSRVWGGVHFRSSIEVSKAMCGEFGDLAYEFVQGHLEGEGP